MLCGGGDQILSTGPPLLKHSSLFIPVICSYGCLFLERVYFKGSHGFFSPIQSSLRPNTVHAP